MKRWLIPLLLVLFVSPAWAANVRVSHLAPMAPTVDVYLNGQRAFKDVPFKSVTAYLNIPDGQYDVLVYPAGRMDNVILDARGVVFQGGNYTITAAGFGPQKSTFPVVFEDRLEAAPNLARLRIINAAIDVPEIDLATTDGVPFALGIRFKTASTYSFFGPGRWSLEVRTGSNSLLRLPTLNLERGKVYTVFIVGARVDGTLNYVITEDVVK